MNANFEGKKGSPSSGLSGTKCEFGCCSRSCVRSTARLCGVLFLCSSWNQININACFKNHICTFLLCCTCLWLVVDAWVCFSLLCFIAHPLTRALRRVQWWFLAGNNDKFTFSPPFFFLPSSLYGVLALWSPAFKLKEQQMSPSRTKPSSLVITLQQSYLSCERFQSVIKAEEGKSNIQLVALEENFLWELI